MKRPIKLNLLHPGVRWWSEDSVLFRPQRIRGKGVSEEDARQWNLGQLALSTPAKGSGKWSVHVGVTGHI